jgi:Tol biopolymer transport system component
VAAQVAGVAITLVMGVLGFGLLGGPVPNVGLTGHHAAAGDVPNRTPDPVKPFQPASIAVPQVAGTILFVKSGRIWSVSGSDVLTPLGTTEPEQSPIWSPDGKTIYFLDIHSKKANVPCSMVAASGCAAANAAYTLEYPVLSRMPATGGAPRAVASDLYSWAGGAYSYFWGLWQPALSPDGRTFALVSDAPNPFALDYAVELMPAAGGALNRLALPEDFGLGQNDAAWSPDGRTLAFTYNHREGTLGRPRIGLYDVESGTVRFLTDYGYAQPAYSPDGNWVAAVRTSAKGRDVVILDAHTGAEILRVSDDGRSFAPTWSPAGDQIAFLHVNGLSIDLWVATLSGSGRSVSVTRTDPLTSQSALDGASRPAWFIPPSEIPRSSPSPSASAISPGSSSAAPSASAGP